jgi:hypothetical protein
MLGGFLHICTCTCTIYYGLWLPDNTSCIFLTWYQSIRFFFGRATRPQFSRSILPSSLSLALGPVTGCRRPVPGRRRPVPGRRRPVPGRRRPVPRPISRRDSPAIGISGRWSAPGPCLGRSAPGPPLPSSVPDSRSPALPVKRRPSPGTARPPARPRPPRSPLARPRASSSRVTLYKNPEELYPQLIHHLSYQ